MAKSGDKLAENKAIVAENNALLYKSSYFFTDEGILKLSSYSRLVNYFMVVSALILIERYLQGANQFSILVVGVLIAAIFAFMVLWVYPEERRMSQFSMKEVKHERGLCIIGWSDISDMKVKGNKISFIWRGAQQKGNLKGSGKEASKFISKKLGKI